MWLSGNAFSTVPANYFKNVSSDVTEIHLHNNPELQMFGDKLFSGMPKLRHVIAHHSGLKALPEKLFDGSVNLKKLWLHNNAIMSIHADAFAGIGGSLEELYLGSNKIAALDAGVFSGLTGLKELHAWNNEGITKNNFGCAHLCDVPTTCDVKFSNFHLNCGTDCPVGDDVSEVTESAGDVCSYEKCVSWDLTNGGWRAGSRSLSAAFAALGAISAVLLVGIDLL